HVDRDAVAGLDPQRHERLRQPRHRAREVAPAHLAPRAVLAEEDSADRERRALRPAMDAGASEVEPAADEPARPLDAARDVQNLVPRRRELELEILDDRGPEPLRLLDRDAVEVVEAPAAEAASEPGHVSPL